MSLTYKTRYNTVTATLIGPWIVTLLVFWIYPLLYALVLSMGRYETFTRTFTWVGIDNYIRAFSNPAFYNALINTTIFTLGTVPVTTTLALSLALAVRKQAPALAGFFRMSFFMPSVTSLVVISLIFTNLYARDGYIGALCAMMGIPYPQMGWLLEPTTALLAIMAMDVWISAGYYMILFLAGMEAIPRDLYESAELSGASGRQQLFRITLPLLRPTLLFIIIINTIKSFQVFVEVYVMTKGGPMGATTTLVYEVYRNAFEQTNSMGYASAVAYIIFAILLLVSLVQSRLLSTKD